MKMVCFKALCLGLPLALLISLNMINGSFSVGFKQNSAASSILNRIKEKRTAANLLTATSPASTARPAPAANSGKSVPITLAAVTGNQGGDSGFVRMKPNLPSNGDILLQYLSNRTPNGKTANQLLEKLASKKGGSNNDFGSIQAVPPASTPTPEIEEITVEEPDGEEEEDLVEVVDNQACSEVPTSVEYECIQKELQQTAYSCSLNFFADVCNVETKTMETKCPVQVQKTITYQCPKLRNKQLCYSQPITVDTVCYGVANEARESKCEKTRVEQSCSIVEEEIPWTCMETQDLVQPFVCSKVEPKTECVPNLVAVEDDCSRETKVPVMYDYYDVEPTKDCQIVRKRNNCPKTVRSVELYPCTETYFERECQDVETPVENMCEVPTIVTEEYICEKTEMQSVKKPCGSSQSQFLSISNRSTKNGSCVQETPVTVTATCTREVEVMKEEPCTEMELQEKCETVRKTRDTTCETSSTTTTQDSCQEWVEEEVCEEVNKTVTRTGLTYETRMESFPCTSTHAKESCVETLDLVEETCTATVQQTNEIPCTRKRKRQVCQDKDVVSVELCADITEQEIEYDCQQTTYEEKCTTVPYYELEACEVTLNETVLEPCQKTFRVTECNPSEESQMGTCFRDEEIENVDVCYKIEYNRECDAVQTTRLLREVLLERASTPK